MSWSQEESDDRLFTAERVDMVAIDLDGTLLRSDGSICAPSAEAIMEATEKGVKVVLCSGRSPRSMLNIYQALGLNTLMIAHNGALVIDPVKDETFSHETMASPLAHRVIEVARSVEPNVATAVEVDGRCFTDTRRRRKPIVAGAVKQAVTPMGSDSEEVDPDSVPAAGFNEASGALVDVLNRPVTKVMFVGASDVLGGIQMSLQAQLADQVGFSFSDLRLLQVVRGGVDKSTAVAKVAAHYGVQRQAVMAIGDAPNDMGVLAWAGLGVALMNAWEEVRKSAHFICPSNDDEGVAEALRRYVLCR
jgi:Cof subfamily protein (haloacid dehalogenase superfamily)